MKKIILQTILRSILPIFVFFLASTTSFGAMLSVEKPVGTVQKGDTVLVKIYLNTEDKEINAIDGVVRISGAVQVPTIYTGSSVFSLWPVYPSFVQSNIVFTGGSPSSVFGNKLHVFTFAITPTDIGTVTIEIPEVTAYLADGKGTVSRTSRSRIETIPVVEKTKNTRDDTRSIVTGDKTKPQAFTIEYGKDATVYDNKVFISFYTTDAGSGIVKYLVQEEGKTYETRDTVYVLKNQNLIGDVTVTAVDGAGNTQTEKITFGRGRDIPYMSIVFFGLVLGIVWYLWVLKRKK